MSIANFEKGIKRMSFEVKHCKIETVALLRSAQAVKFKVNVYL